MHLEGVDVSITGNSTNPTRFQHPVAGTYKKECVEQGKKYFSVASGGGTGRTLHPDNMALAGTVVKLGLHIGEAVDAGDNLGGVLAQAVEDDAQGFKDVEECRAICQEKGFDPYEIVKGIQPICFENACWAYCVGAAIWPLAFSRAVLASSPFLMKSIILPRFTNS
mgnify:CR=1 FL=1